MSYLSGIDLAQCIGRVEAHVGFFVPERRREVGNRGDRFARGGLKGLPQEDLAADMYALTQDLTRAAGLPDYEVSNHATPGNESRHNLIYWQ